MLAVMAPSARQHRPLDAGYLATYGRPCYASGMASDPKNETGPKTETGEPMRSAGELAQVEALGTPAAGGGA